MIKDCGVLEFVLGRPLSKHCGAWRQWCHYCNRDNWKSKHDLPATSDITVQAVYKYLVLLLAALHSRMMSFLRVSQVPMYVCFFGRWDGGGHQRCCNKDFKETNYLRSFLRCYEVLYSSGWRLCGHALMTDTLLAWKKEGVVSTEELKLSASILSGEDSASLALSVIRFEGD